MNASTLLGRLAPFENKNKILVEDQSTTDIIDAICKAHNKHVSEYKKISSFFNAGTPRKTGKKIYDFLKDNVKYVIEPGSKQTVKSPAAILATGYGDCKHYSLFAGGILQNLGIPFAYRFASYKNFNSEPQHVFVVINPGTANEIFVDPVLNEFDYKKPYTYAKDRYMAIYSISGVGATAQQKAALKAAKAAKKAAPTEAARAAARQNLQAARKAANRTAGQVLQKGTKAVLKVAAAPARAAFLGLVALNFGGLATKLARGWQKAPSRITNFWEGAGGQINALKKAWEKGSKKKRIFGAIGVAPAAPAAAAATAAPLLVKVANVLTKIGIDPQDLVQLGKDAVNAKAQQLAKQVLEPKAATQAEYIDTADEVFKGAPTMDVTSTPAFTKAAATSKPNFLPLILGGAAVLYFVNRK